MRIGRFAALGAVALTTVLAGCHYHHGYHGGYNGGYYAKPVVAPKYVAPKYVAPAPRVVYKRHGYGYGY